MANINNADKKAIITGTADNDNIYNSGAYSTITAAAGDDSIDNLASNVVINAGDGNDGIYNKGKTKVTIDAGDGNDEINSYSSITIIRGGTGDDYISTSNGNHVTINGGDGSDTIVSSSQRASINGDAGDDIIYVNASGNTIRGGKGSDTIIGSRYADTFVYVKGDGNDVFTNYQVNDLIKIESGKMSSASVSGNDFIIYVGNGSLTIQDALNKRVKLIDDYKKITYLNPADYVESNINEGSIKGSDTNDTINNGNNPGGYNFGDNATIDAAGGNDKITNKGLNVYIDAGTGNDTINNTGSGTTIIGAAGNDSIKTKGNNVSVNGGDGKDYIYNYVNSNYVTLNGDSGNDKIYNYGANALVSGNDEDDYIYNGIKAANSTLNGGEGNDSIRNAGAADVLIIGGPGNDSLYSTGNNVTINGGIGDDIVRVNAGNHLMQYAEGDGNDTIFGYKTKDTINITSGSITSHTVKGNDVILYISTGSITLKNTKNKKITIADSDGSVTSQIYAEEFPEGIVPNKTKTAVTVSPPFEGTFDLNDYPNIKNVDASQSDCSVVVIGNDRANIFKAGSGGGTLDGGKGNDILYGGSGADMLIYSQGGGSDVIYNYESGQDSIQLTSDVTVSKVSVRGNHVTLYFEGGGSIKVRDAKGKALTIEENGSTGTYTFTKDTNGLSDTLESAYMEKTLLEVDDKFNTNDIDSFFYLSSNKIKDNPSGELSFNNRYSFGSTINQFSASVGSFSKN